MSYITKYEMRLSLSIIFYIKVFTFLRFSFERRFGKIIIGERSTSHGARCKIDWCWRSQGDCQCPWTRDSGLNPTSALVSLDPHRPKNDSIFFIFMCIFSTIRWFLLFVELLNYYWNHIKKSATTVLLSCFKFYIFFISMQFAL